MFKFLSMAMLALSVMFSTQTQGMNVSDADDEGSDVYMSRQTQLNVAAIRAANIRDAETHLKNRAAVAIAAVTGFFVGSLMLESFGEVPGNPWVMNYGKTLTLTCALACCLPVIPAIYTYIKTLQRNH